MMPDLSVATAARAMRRLTEAERLLEGIDLSAVAPADLPAITDVLRRIEGRCAAVGVAVATRAKATGNDPSAALLGRGRVSGRRASQEAKRADVVDRMPQLGRRLQSGEVSGEHIDAITRARSGLTGDEVQLFDQLDPELADAATKLPVDTFNRKLRTLVDDARADHGMTRLQQQRARSSLKMWTDPDGMGHLHITSDPERFAHIRTAIEYQTASLASAAKHDNQGVTIGPALQLEALVELLTCGQHASGRPTITVLVDHETLMSGPHAETVCETESGVQLPPPVIDRYLCDAAVQRVSLDDAGVPIHVGRKHRTATHAQWAALIAMYATCVWKGCDRPITWTQAHHIHHWEHGGRTDLDNLVPLCSRHHHMVHDDGWQLWLHPDRSLEIYRPVNNRDGSNTQFDTVPHGERCRTAPYERPNRESLWATTTPDRQPGRRQPSREQPGREQARRERSSPPTSDRTSAQRETPEGEQSSAGMTPGNTA